MSTDTTLSLTDAMTTCGLTGPTWAAWRVVAKALDGAGDTFTRDEAALYEQCTQRTRPPTERPAEFFGVIGRRGGKSIFTKASVLVAASRRYALAPGERAVIAAAGADREQGRVLFSYHSALFNPSTPSRILAALAALVTRRTRWSLDLANDVSLEVSTSHFGRIRGRSFALAIADELSFWSRDDGSN